MHFTTSRLAAISSEYLAMDAQYRQQQAAVVKSAVQTVQSYLPIVEACSQLVSLHTVCCRIVNFCTALHCTGLLCCAVLYCIVLHCVVCFVTCSLTPCLSSPGRRARADR